MSLSTRLIGPITLITTLALTFVAGSAYEKAKKVLFSNIVTLESTVIDGISRELKTLLDSSESYMRVTAQRNAVIGYASKCLARPNAPIDPAIQKNFQDQLEKSTELYHYIDFLYFVDKNGIVRASSSGVGEGSSRADRSYFIESLHGANSLQGPLPERATGNYALFLGEPVFVDGQIAGVICGALNMEAFSQKTIDPATLNGHGFAYVIDSNGQIILHPNREKMIGNHMIEQAVFEVVTDGGAGSFEYVSEGTDYYSTYQTMPNGWVVVVTVSRNLIIRELNSMRDGIILATFLAIWLVFFAMFTIISRIVASLREGVHFAESVAAGNLDRTFDIEKKDEIGALAAALNSMVGRLKSSLELAERRTKEAELAKAEATSTFRELQAVINSVDGGVAKFVLDDHLHILWANSGFYALSGRTQESYAQDTENCGIDLIHPEDRNALFEVMEKLPSERSILCAEYRIHRKDGSYSWTYARAKHVGEWEKYPLFIGVFVDITQTKEAMKELKLEKQRYEIITEITEEILFEHDLVHDTVNFSGGYEKIFGFPGHMTDYLKKRKGLPFLAHPDDLHLFKKAEEDFNNKKEFVQFCSRFKTREYGYQWFDVCFKALHDDQGIPIKLIGRITNVHKKKVEEDRLRKEAQTDMLTGLYNKVTFEQRSAQMMEKTPYAHALVIVDIDDFKLVNDTYGHPFGDMTIRTVGSIIHESFRTTDIIGRIGGDEFAVFAININGISSIQKRCRQLVEKLEERNFNNGYHISVSVGISIYPAHGKDYPTLFAHADAALYQLKKHHGKGGFAIYSNTP